VTLNFGGAITISSLTMGAFTGTWDNSVNNNNITFVAGVSTPFSISGSGARVIKLGSATYTIPTSGSSTFTAATVTNLTFDAGTSTITWSGSAGHRTFNGGGLTYSTVTLAPFGASPSQWTYIFSGSNTFLNLNISGPVYIQFPSSTTQTVTNAINWTGTASNPIGFYTSTAGASVSIVATAGGSLAYVSLRDLSFSVGSVTATNSFNLGNNSGVTITGPSSGGGAGVIGS
jgi:hypothetical protein